MSEAMEQTLQQDGAIEDDEDGFGAPPPALTTQFDHPMWPKIKEAIREVYDPEIPVNIYELGLIYKVDIKEDKTLDITMTLTAPGCPVAGEMPGWVQDAVESVDGVKAATVEIVWDPPWTPDMMTEFAKMELGMF